MNNHYPSQFKLLCFLKKTCLLQSHLTDDSGRTHGYATTSYQMPVRALHLFRHKMFRMMWMCCLLMLSLSVFASDVDVPPVDAVRFPTVLALQSSPPPTADRYELARRFYGVTDIPIPPTTPTAYQIGDVQSFTITTTASGRAETFDATLRAISEHVYVWIESSVTTVSDSQAMDFARRFDDEVYDTTRELWGDEPSPGIDGDLRLHMLFSARLQENVGGFFMAQNGYSRVVVPDSNEHEMMIFNVNAYGGNLGNDRFISSAAHEFQHMINNHNDPDESDWMNEGYSMLTEHLLNIDDNSWAYNSFLQAPDMQLNSWGTAPFKSQEYGASMLFVLYFYEQFGLEGIQRLGADSANGLQSVDNVLREMNGRNVENFFADWVLANVIRNVAHGYGYHTLPANAMNTPRRYLNVPFAITENSPQYATHYYQIENPASNMSLTFTMIDTVQLVDVPIMDGDSFWYGVRSNNSNPTLTRAFDLSDVDVATLNYRVWYDLELGWDYGYVSVSVDDGQTWQIQSTRLTTADNPNGKAYGVGYSGESNGWQNESIVLDNYVGREILVRFETITDDATLRTGMAVDDIRLDAVDYFTDANSSDDSWVGNGWIRTDNRLPQRAWVQVVEMTTNNIEVSRFLAEGDSIFTINDIDDDAHLLIAVSPFAPITLQETSYSLVASAQE